MRPSLHLSYAAGLDWLECAPLGVVMDRQGSDRWRGVTDKFGWFLDEPHGAVIGFKVVDFSEFEPVEEIFDGPHFDVPALGLRDVSAGEIVLAAVPFLDGRDTVDRLHFDAAMSTKGEKALFHWTAALQAGNSMAHYGAGYTLLDLGRPHEAYRHLRNYTEVVPRDAWAWAYRARAALALGERAEAVGCLERAIAHEEVYGEETDAHELLAQLRAPARQPETLAYWDYDRNATIVCTSCDWAGAANRGEAMHRDLLDVTCPGCQKLLLMIPFPTVEETRAAAAAGNERAQAELGTVDVVEARWARAAELALASPDQLPELPGEALTIEWDFEEHDGESFTVLRHEGAEIWRELAFYEGFQRFEEVAEILERRYGSRLVAVEPTRASEVYLYGDRISSPRRIEAVNERLRRRHEGAE